jgi:tight adherence protein B
VSVLAAALLGLAVFTATRRLVGRPGVADIERRVLSNVGVVAVSPAVAYEPSAGRLGRLVDSLERRLARHGRWRAFEERVARAGIARRPVEVGAAVAAASVVAAFFGLASASGLTAVLLLLAPVGVTWWLLGVLAARRLRQFDAQLPDVLSALGASLRAGHSFLQSLQAVAQDTPKPAGDEFRRALREARLGRPVEDALAGVGRRVASRDFAYVLTAISVQRQAGGSLAGLFDTVNDTVRQRQQFARKVRALTATGRTSAHALIALPFGMAVLLTALNHHYLVPLFVTHGGRIMLIGSGVMMGIGIVVVRRVVSFRG